jgi:acyl dehydratase
VLGEVRKHQPETNKHESSQASDCFLEEMMRNFEELGFLGDTLHLTSWVTMTSEKRIDATAGNRNVITGHNMFADVSGSHTVAFGGVLLHPLQNAALNVVIQAKMTSACVRGLDAVCKCMGDSVTNVLK